MAKFPFRFTVFHYQSGVDRLERAFTSSIAQIEAEQAQASAAYMAYIKSGEDDAEYEYDGENRFLVKSTAFELQNDSFEIGLSAQAIREAFIIAAYHFWEKFAISRTGKWGFDNLTKSYCYPVHEKLPALNKLNNHFKHDSDLERMTKLHDNWQDIFVVAPHITDKTKKPHWILDVRNDHVLEAFQIVRSSGPIDASPPS